jgi:hypothetical protein
MSGAASVPLTIAAIFFPHPPLKFLFAVLAAYGVVQACYLVWRDSLREAQGTIAKQKKEIEQLRALVAKPPRTAADQHRYDTGRKLLQGFGERKSIAVQALRHLRAHGSLTFGTFAPPLPPGLKLDDVLWAYGACLPDGLVTVSQDHPRGERTFSIPLAMNALLDELLYES